MSRMRKIRGTFRPREFVKANSDRAAKAVDGVRGTLQGVSYNLSEDGLSIGCRLYGAR